VLDLDLVLPNLISDVAARDPERVFAQETTGAAVTYAEMHEASLLGASAYRATGVAAGDTVVTMLPTAINAVWNWLSLSWLGAIDMPVNTDYRGDILDRLLVSSHAAAIVIGEQYLDRIEGLDGAKDVRVLVVPADAGPLGSGVRTETGEDFLASATTARDLEPPQPWDIAFIICTSGTTGPSKGVLVPWGQAYATATGIVATAEELDQTDVIYAPLPMYHIANRAFVYMAAVAGNRVVLREKFSFTEFWDDVAAFGCTISSMGPPPYPAATPLRIAGGNKPIPDYEAVSAQLGIQLTTCYSMTELSVPIRSGPTIENERTCGRVRSGFPGYEVRVVDEHDAEVGPGVAGELIVRSSEPWTMNAGYLGMPEQTVEAWRNGWFHTGDAFTYDADGRFYYVDRLKDAIRRRGENISSWEVETGVNAHPDVLACAAIAVPDSSSDDEVKVVVIAVPGRTLTPEDLITFLVPRMPRFMIPRYVEFVDELPLAEATFKVQKVKLREVALNDRTWDRVAAGLELPR
jgi:crotonobetaine/carnitine-CoA ligase